MIGSKLKTSLTEKVWAILRNMARDAPPGAITPREFAEVAVNVVLHELAEKKNDTTADQRFVALTYLATPYTRYPGGHDAAFELACQSAAVFLAAGIPVFSPIAHSHPIAKHMAAEHLVDHDLWVRIDAPMLAACGAMIVVTADGWRDSRGVQHEITMFEQAGKPIIYWAPDESIPSKEINDAR